MTLESTPNPADNDRGYEQRDVQARAIVWLFGGIAAAVIAAVVGLWFARQALQRAAEKRDPALSPLAGGPVSPPPPRLQSDPRADLQVFRAREDRVLSSYGWVNRERGVVRIPIDRAIELLIERGEPSVPAPAVTNPPVPTR
jgi:hypothetical protein